MTGILFEARAFRLSSRTARYASRSEPAIEPVATQGVLDPSSQRGAGFRCDSDGREALAHEAAVALLVGLDRMGGALRVLGGVPGDLAVGR